MYIHKEKYQILKPAKKGGGYQILKKDDQWIKTGKSKSEGGTHLAMCRESGPSCKSEKHTI